MTVEDGQGPRWRPRTWRDPSTVAAFVLLIVAVTLIVLDGMDEVLWHSPVTFGYWPYLLMLCVAFWFFGLRLWRMSGRGED